MQVTAQKAELKSFNTPDEVRTFPKGKLELVNVGGAVIGRATLEPGWRWSTSVCGIWGQVFILHITTLSFATVLFYK